MQMQDRDILPVEIEIVDLVRMAKSLPGPPSPEVLREAMISTIVDILASETEVVLVQGPDGIGKTTLLAQFARTHANQSLSIFARTASRYAYDARMLIDDLCDQLIFALNNKRFVRPDDADPLQLVTTLLFELQKKANREKMTFYFVVDGLDDIPIEDSEQRRMLIDVLPFGLSSFRFILSGEVHDLAKNPHKAQTLKEFHVSGFAFGETKAFFDGLNIDDLSLKMIHRLTRFIPGNQASVRRLLKSGIPIDKLLEQFSDHPPDWIEYEWNAAVHPNPLLKTILAILAFDSRPHSLETLTRLCKADIEDVQKCLQTCSLLEINATSLLIEFVCDVHRHLTAKRLAGIKRETHDLIISELLQKPDGSDALNHLPVFLHQAKRHEELLEYLSPEHIGALINCGESWAPLHQKAELGIQTAAELKRDGDLLRFGLHASAIRSMELSAPWRSELEAYVALEDYSSALAMAQRMATKEDRLHSLAVVARAQKIKKIHLESEVSDQIHQLFRAIDLRALGAHGVEIAAELLHTSPELALELIQECSGSGIGENRPDLVFASLSFKALLSKGESMATTQKALREKVKDPAIQKFVDTMSVVFGQYDAHEVLHEVSNWERSTDKLYALRIWCVTNAEKNDANSVVEYALNLLLADTANTANAKVYNELSQPLVHLPSTDVVASIVVRLDGLMGAIECAGPTAEYVNLQTTLVKAQMRYDRIAAFDRAQDLLFYADVISDPSTKLVSFTLLARLMKAYEAEGTFDALYLLTIDTLMNVIDTVLSTTADHYEAIHPAIEAFTGLDIDIALKVIARMNTLPRRDAALQKLVAAMARNKPTKANFLAITKAYEAIQSVGAKANATDAVLSAVVRHKDAISTFGPELIAIRTWIEASPSSERKCYNYCSLVVTLSRITPAAQNSLMDSIFKDLAMAFGNIDAAWVKVSVGFLIVSELAQTHPALSRDFFVRTEAVKRTEVLATTDTVKCYVSCVRLALRCLSGLMKKKVWAERDIEALGSLIEKIPSTAAQVLLWGELALKFHLAGDHVKCNEIVRSSISPILESTKLGDSEARWRTTSGVAPAIFCSHPASARILISKLPRVWQDDAYSSICQLLVAKKIPTEEYDPQGTIEPTVTYPIFVDVVELISAISADYCVYGEIENLIDGMDGKFQNRFNKQQQATVIQSLERLVASKFPNPDYITHEGYRILGEMQIARLQSNKVQWVDLVERARKLPNIADSIFVLICLAEARAKKDKKMAVALFNEVNSLIPNIGFFEDRISRYEMLAKVCTTIDKELSKACLRQAWNECTPSQDPDVQQKSRRRLIDFAHRLDPEFAGSLASESDDDPAREFARAENRQRLQTLNLRQRVAGGEIEALTKSRGIKQQVEVAQMMLSSLNSHRTPTVHTDETRKSMLLASKMPMDEAFEILSWVTENAVQRHCPNDHANLFLRPLFEASCLSSELAYRIAARMRQLKEVGLTLAREFATPGDHLIGPEQQEQVLQLIVSWAGNAADYIYITDPYFGLEELKFIGTIRSVAPKIPITIVTSREHLLSSGVTSSLDDVFRAHWRMHISDCDPGDVTLVVVGLGESGAHPIHDRWWISSGSGLRFGTSANSIGSAKLSEISIMSSDESAKRQVEIERLTSGSVYGVAGMRVRRITYVL